MNPAAILAWINVASIVVDLLSKIAPAVYDVFRKIAASITGKGDAATAEDVTEWLGVTHKGLALMPEVWAEAKGKSFHLSDPEAEKARRMLYVAQVLAGKLSAKESVTLSDTQAMAISQQWFAGERAADPGFGR